MNKYYEKIIKHISGNDEERIRNRMGFLKEKIMRNVEEVKRLAQVLLSSSIKANFLKSRKPKYFNILKTKKIRENSPKEQEKCFQNKIQKIDTDIKDSNCTSINFDHIFNYEFSSHSEKDSLNEGIISHYSHKEDEDEIFNSVFDPKFISINQFKEEDEEFIDLSCNITNNKKNFQNKNLSNISEKKDSNLANPINSSPSGVNESIFNDDEINGFYSILNKLKTLNSSSQTLNKNFQSLDNFSRKKRYVILSSEEKKNIVELAKETNIKEVSKKFGVPLKSLKRWILYGPERKKGAGRKEKDPEMEILLNAWYKEFHIKNKHYVTSKVLKNKALQFSKFDDFVASKDWLNKFKRKYNVETIKEAELQSLLK